jgi:hypothetical protein
VTTPKQRVDNECARRGKLAVVAGCERLARGDYGDTDLIVALAPQGSAKYFDGRPHDDVYWFRVWGMRGLVWAWDDSATPTVVTAMNDEAWRVRELAAKVVARHVIGDALPAVAALRADPIPRVRAAASRAVAALSNAGA